jgi:4-amino-4-deoxy-L-arabinose transferase-like glycosyltransferase
LVAFSIHFYFVTINWTWGFMLGHEFRQAQTALITDYIDRQNNFGVYYETPILGKPWAFPLEFPFYQWAVVGVERLFAIKDYEAARTVSLSCFYLALPAFFILLGAAGVSRARRWIFLALMMFCPVYVFYSRAFLIDPMAMMFSAWFLTAFVQTMRTRKWQWWVVCTVAGSIGALIKSLVFLVWLFPAAVFGAVCLWNAAKSESRGKAMLGTMGWGVSSVIMPYLLLSWWVGFTDALKAAHPSGYIFTSEALTTGNFGTFSLSSRFSWETWRDLGARWSEAIAMPWAVGLIVLTGVVLCPRERKNILIFSGVWLFGQMAFPYAYAYQDYYFYAGAAFLVFVFGWVVTGILETAWLPKWGRVGLALLPFVAMGKSYHNYYYTAQIVKSHGGSAVTRLLKDMLPRESVIVIMGQDWAAIVPYYSQRRALMIRKGLEEDAVYVKGAIADLNDEDIAALVVSGDALKQTVAVQRVVELAGLVAEPVFHESETVVYMSPLYSNTVRDVLQRDSNRYPALTLLPKSERDTSVGLDFKISAGASRLAFPTVKPEVARYRISHEYGRFLDEAVPQYNFHADSDLWLRTPAEVQGFRWKYGVVAGAWNGAGGKTNGVDFVIFAESKNGQRRELWRDEVTPAEVEADRGLQTGEGSLEIHAGEQLVFACRDRDNRAFDWAYFTSIEVW